MIAVITIWDIFIKYLKNSMEQLQRSIEVCIIEYYNSKSVIRLMIKFKYLVRQKNLKSIFNKLEKPC